jgi:hypothetical protein
MAASSSKDQATAIQLGKAWSGRCRSPAMWSLPASAAIFMQAATYAMRVSPRNARLAQDAAVDLVVADHADQFAVLDQAERVAGPVPDL